MTGTYAWSRGEDSVAGCILQVLHKHTLEPYDQMEFMLGCNRGAPSYNSGEAAGEMIVGFPNRNVAVAVYSPVYEHRSDGRCSLIFEFNTDVVTVTQVGMDYHCRFGHGVYADGTYDRVDSGIPQFGCLFDGSCEWDTDN